MSSKEKSAVLIQGVVDKQLFDVLKNRFLKKAFVMEGRPTLEAADSACRELLKRKIVPTLISDNMAGLLFYKNMVKEVWLAYQYADKEGAICDSGALILGVLGLKHNVLVYLYPAARKTRFLGRQSDLVKFKKTQIAPQGIKGYVPLVEWLPKKYITRIHS